MKDSAKNLRILHKTLCDKYGLKVPARFDKNFWAAEVVFSFNGSGGILDQLPHNLTPTPDNIKYINRLEVGGVGKVA